MAGSGMICRMPHEMLVMIAEQMGPRELKSFRLTSKLMASMGFGSLHKYVSDTVRFLSHNELKGDKGVQFVHDMHTLLMQTWTKEAAAVTDLMIEVTTGDHLSLPPSLAGVHFKALDSLQLTGVTLDRSTLLKVLETHRKTLTWVSIRDVGLMIPQKDGRSPIRRAYREWISILEFIRDNMKLHDLVVHGLTWSDAAEGKLSEVYLKTPFARYNPMYNDANGSYKLSNGGLQANGDDEDIVRDGLNELLNELHSSLKLIKRGGDPART
jgi:hypothetical protein